jgi:hypothetical protein
MSEQYTHWTSLSKQMYPPKTTNYPPTYLHRLGNKHTCTPPQNHPQANHPLTDTDWVKSIPAHPHKLTTHKLITLLNSTERIINMHTHTDSWLTCGPPCLMQLLSCRGVKKSHTLTQTHTDSWLTCGPPCLMQLLSRRGGKCWVVPTLGQHAPHCTHITSIEKWAAHTHTHTHCKPVEVVNVL